MADLRLLNLKFLRSSVVSLNMSHYPHTCWDTCPNWLDINVLLNTTSQVKCRKEVSYLTKFLISHLKVGQARNPHIYAVNSFWALLFWALVGFFLPPRIEHTCLLCRQLWNFSRESVLQYSVITMMRSSIKWHQLSHVMIGAQWKQVFVWV